MRNLLEFRILCGIHIFELFQELFSIAPLKVVSWNYLAKFVLAGRWGLHFRWDCHLHQHPNPEQSSEYCEIDSRFKPFQEVSSIAPLREVSMNLTRISHVWQNVRLQQDLNRFPELSSIAPLKVVSWNYLAKFVSFGREVVFTFTVGLSPASAPKSTTIKRSL